MPPSGTMTLGADQLFIVDSDVDCLVLASPAGVVSISQDSGPVKIRGRFVDGVGGKVETRTYKGKTIFVVEAAGSGRVELLIVPQGAAAGDVIRRTLDVGQVPPKPDPVDPVVTPTALWGFVVVEETEAAVAGRGALLADSALATFLKAKGYRWRIVDKDVVGTDGKPPADVARMLNASKGKTYPQVFIVDAKGNIVTQQNLPDAAGVTSLLKKWGQ